MSSVLVVDDDATVRDIVVQYLQQAGFSTLEAADGVDAVAIAMRDKPDAIVLDLMLPGIDGMEVFRRVRDALGGVPTIMLTARDDEPQRILGLEMGADDYVTKPFSPREVVLRVQAVLRRAAADAPEKPAVLTHGRVTLDGDARTVIVDGRPASFTTREFDLLHHLMSHPGAAMGREDLMREVWGWEYGDETTVTVHIRRLREKIEVDPSAPAYIVTVWGVGYRWDGATAGEGNAR